MTDQISQDTPPDDVLAAAEALCRLAALDLYTALKQIRDGKLDDLKTANGAMRELRTTLHIALEERARIDKLRKQGDGALQAVALDLDAARREILERLDRLGAADGG